MSKPTPNSRPWNVSCDGMGSESVTKTLIYTSAKPVILEKPKQITAVNGILERLHIISHQFTSRGNWNRPLSEDLGAVRLR